MKTDSYRLRQIKVPQELYNFVKQYCRHRKITMMEFYFKMLAWFIERYGDDVTLIYHASYKSGHALSLWIKENQLNIIEKIAIRANISDARVVYTAMVMYAEQVK